jgi:uncharacterized protein
MKRGWVFPTKKSMHKVLITGASGLIGSHLTSMLVKKGYAVAHVGRIKRSGPVPNFIWNVEAEEIDDAAFDGVDAVVHLAGAGVAEKLWTVKRKQEIVESRTRSTALLARHLQKHQQVKTVISASGINYYACGLTDQVFTETSQPGSDYLAKVVEAWEKAADGIENKRVVKLRTGIVLSKEGGALKEMMRPVVWGVGAPLGSGRQFLSWIHIDDLCRIYVKALEDTTLQGTYNAVAPGAVTNRAFIKSVAKTINRPLWLPAIPEFALKLVLGEMADMVLKGCVVSPAKIQQTGFVFQFDSLDKALNNLLK